MATATNTLFEPDPEMVTAVVKATTDTIIKHLRALPRETQADGREWIRAIMVDMIIEGLKLV